MGQKLKQGERLYTAAWGQWTKPLAR
jgi:hypothetical protein